MYNIYYIEYPCLKVIREIVRIIRPPGMTKHSARAAKTGTCVFRGILYIVHVNYDNYYHR